MRKQTLWCTAAVVLFATQGALAQSNVDRGSPDRTPQAQGTAPSPNTTAPRNDQARERAQPTPQAQTPQRQNGTNQPATAQQQQQQPSTAQQPTAQPSTAQQQPSTTPGTAGTQQQPQAPSTAQQASPPANTQATQPSTAPQSNQTAQPAQPSTQQNANRQNGSASGVVSLNAQQRTQVGQVIARTNVRPATNVNFSISVGTAVPRSVTVHALPAELVTIVPQYRGYSYFVVEEQVVIVEPSSHQIVAVMPYTGSGTRASATRATQTRAVSLTNEQRNVVRKHATQRRASEPPTTTTTRKRYSVGDQVDRSVTIETFPDSVYEEVPVVRRHRYFRDDDRVLLVDPDEDRIVEIIE